MVKINCLDVPADNSCLQDYLTGQGFRTDRIAVELNGRIVPRATYSSVTLTPGDTVEIVQFVGGG